MNINQINFPWEEYFSQQNPMTPGLSTTDYSNFYYIIIILGIIALVLIVIYALVGEDKEETQGYE